MSATPSASKKLKQSAKPTLKVGTGSLCEPVWIACENDDPPQHARKRRAFAGRHSHRGLQMRNLMWEFLIAMVFLVGTVLLLGGELFFGHLFSVPSVAIGIGGVLCILATIAKERIDRDMTTP